MPITALDPKTALVVIDLQNSVVSLSTTPPSSVVVAGAKRLAEAFRARKLPVVLVHVKWAPDMSDSIKTRTDTKPPVRTYGPGAFDYVDGLAGPGDILVQKRQWGAFYGTDLDLQLRRRGVTGIVLCGISTSIGVESTARDAWERGYQIAFVADALADMNVDAHDRALKIIFPRLGEIGSIDEILAKLPT